MQFHEYRILAHMISRQWARLSEAIAKKDMEGATAAKCAVEDAQREITRKREEKGIKHVPRFFELRDGLWQAKIRFVFVLQLAGLLYSLLRKYRLPDDTEGMVDAVQRWMFAPPP